MDDDSLEIETRPMECELGTITRADGSATVRQGDTVGKLSRENHTIIT